MMIDVAQLEQLGEAIDGGLVLGTPDGQVLAASPRARALLDLPPGAGRGRVAAQLSGALYPLAGPDAAPLASPLGRAPLDEDVACRVHDGRQRRLRCSARALGSPEGRLIALTLREIPPPPPLAEPLALDPEIRRLQQLRDEILSIASHELKNPLTVILGYGAMLAGAPEVRAQPRLARAAEAVRQQSQRMRCLVDQLLDFSRLGLGRLTLQRAPFDLAAQVRALPALHPAARAALRVVAPDEPFLVLGDAVRLERVLASLVTSALRHRPEGSEVLVSLRRAAGADLAPTAYGRMDATRSYALVEVCDPGLRPELAEHPHIFARYASVGEHDSPQAEHWLGLYVGAQVILLHSGVIWLEHRPHAGGAVCYALPLA